MGISYVLRGGWSTDDDPFPKTYRVYDTGEIEEDDADRNWDDEAYKVYTELVSAHKGEREWRITLEDFEKALEERRKHGRA